MSELTEALDVIEGLEKPLALSKSELSDWLSTLNCYISKAFDNEKSFLSSFWNGSESDELLELYMASERCRIAVLVDSGATVTTTIDTVSFINWCMSR